MGKIWKLTEIFIKYAVKVEKEALESLLRISLVGRLEKIY